VLKSGIGRGTLCNPAWKDQYNEQQTIQFSAPRKTKNARSNGEWGAITFEKKIDNFHSVRHIFV
jgi:hypothetical protein